MRPADLLPALGPLADGFVPGRVRLHHGGSPFARLVCVLSGGRAVALGNHLFFPARQPIEAGTLLHELAHAAQYQRWGAARYYALALADRLRELGWRGGLCRSPYHWDPAEPFETCGMEAQAQRLEDAFRATRRTPPAPAP